MDLVSINGRITVRPNTERISFKLHWRETPVDQAEIDAWAEQLGFTKTRGGEMVHRDGRSGMMWPQVQSGEVVFESKPTQMGAFATNPFPFWFYAFARAFFKGCPFSHTFAGIPINAGLMQSEEEFQRRETARPQTA